MNEHTIYLGGGCFWGLQGYIKKIEGVLSTEVGYANGPTEIQAMKMYVTIVATLKPSR